MLLSLFHRETMVPWLGSWSGSSPMIICGTTSLGGASNVPDNSAGRRARPDTPTCTGESCGTNNELAPTALLHPWSS